MSETNNNEILDLARQTRKRLQQDLNRKRLDQLRAKALLEEFGGKDDIEGCVVEIVNAHSNGILQTTLNQVVPDATAEHRKKLVREGKIDEVKVGQTWLLKPIPHEPAEKDAPSRKVNIDREEEVTK